MLWGVSKVLAAREGVNEGVGQVLECWGEQRAGMLGGADRELQEKQAWKVGVKECKLSKHPNVHC